MTGGEPLVRRDVATSCGCSGRSTHPRHLDDHERLPPRDHAEALADAGLDRVTVSLDSLIRHRFAEMTLRDALDEVLRGASMPRPKLG